MSNSNYKIRTALAQEFHVIGKLMVEVYSQLEGFPKETEQPNYYKMLANVGDLTQKPGTEIIVATNQSKIYGAVVFFNDMQYYGSGGTATQEKNASGFRLLAVDSQTRGYGIGKNLTQECIKRARERNSTQVIIHTTKAMQTAWAMYERMGFKRSTDLDFMQGELPVYGFRLIL
jgi:GNAT superfamily N-acetyltransferase